MDFLMFSTLSCKGKERTSSIRFLVNFPRAFYIPLIIRLSLDTEMGTEIYFDFLFAATELSPLKYNSKLMNSIWGLYNRYSVHNIKQQNTDGNIPNLGEQQQFK